MGSLPIWHLYIYNELKVSRPGVNRDESSAATRHTETRLMRK